MNNPGLFAAPAKLFDYWQNYVMEAGFYIQNK